MEADSSEMVFQKELPIPQPVKSSASRLLGKPEATKTYVKLASPTADPLLKKNFFRGAPAISKEKSQPYTIDKRSTYTALTNRQQKAVAATTAVTTCAIKKHCDRCCASQGSITSAVKRVMNPQVPYKAPKNLLATGYMLSPHICHSYEIEHTYGSLSTIGISTSSSRHAIQRVDEDFSHLFSKCKFCEFIWRKRRTIGRSLSCVIGDGFGFLTWLRYTCSIAMHIDIICSSDRN